MVVIRPNVWDDYFVQLPNAKGRVVVYHKECCYAGEYAHKELLKQNVDAGLDLTGEVKKFTYEAKGMSPIYQKKNGLTWLKCMTSL